MMKITRESEEIVLLKEQVKEVEEEEDEEEALSLCDLPNNEENQTKKEASEFASEVQLEDFDFDSCGGNLLKESEMCTADEIFYQGQILPLRHSISLPSDRRNCTIQSMSMSAEEHCHETNSSSRSSSIRSQRSSSSGSSSNFSPNYKPKIRNQFHSHPSPTPQVRFSKVNSQSNVKNSTRKSALWSLFRVGLVTPPEIALQDLKNRGGNRDNSGSRNSTSSSSSGSFGNNDNRMRSIIVSKKKKQRLFSLGSCKCSANAVETLLPSNVLITNSSKSTLTKIRKATEGDKHEDKKDSSDNIKATKKQAMSRHRTSEWLKQLSLEGPSDET